MINNSITKLVLFLLVALFFIMGVYLGVKLCPYLDAIMFRDTYLQGTSLRLFIKRVPFEIYTETNNKAFAVFKGHYCLFRRECLQDDMIQITHFNNGLAVLDSVYDKVKKETVKVTYTTFDRNSTMQYAYMDNDADGVWDILIDFKNKQKFIWKSNQWTKGKTGSDQGKQ